MLDGFCSKCHKVWTLDTKQGVCQWCSKPSNCQESTVTPRTIKSRANGRRKQIEAHSNGYGELDGEYAIYYKVASRFNQKAQAQDRDDLLQDIILTLALVAKNNGHKPFTEAMMYRIASRTVADYWYRHYKVNNGLDCGHCSKAQSQKCKEDWLYSECPKAIKLESLNQEVVDSEGNITELGELIADDKAIDLDAWLDARTWLLGCRDRLIAVADKMDKGQALTSKERQYLWYWRKKEQKALALS